VRKEVSATAMVCALTVATLSPEGCGHCASTCPWPWRSSPRFSPASNRWRAINAAKTSVIQTSRAPCAEGIDRTLPAQLQVGPIGRRGFESRLEPRRVASLPAKLEQTRRQIV